MSFYFGKQGEDWSRRIGGFLDRDALVIWLWFWILRLDFKPELEEDE